MDKDLKNILVMMFPSLLDAMTSEVGKECSMPSPPSRTISDSEKETMLYMGGSILRKLFYRAKTAEER